MLGTLQYVHNEYTVTLGNVIINPNPLSQWPTAHRSLHLFLTDKDLRLGS